MSVYSLDHVIQECIDQHVGIVSTARGKSPLAKVEIYTGAWLSLNMWIESKLSKHKGASVSGFGSFCWEMIEKDNETHCRPLFLPSDAFVKLHKVRRQRIHRSPQVTPVEEVNYSLLAIKYSKNLTKDMVYAGIHDILKKIGDFICRGYEMEIDFTFGTLCAKENRVKFIFSQARLLEILPENLEPDVIAHDLAPLRYVVPEDAAGNSARRPGSSRQGSARGDTAQRPSTGVQLPKLGKGLTQSLDSSLKGKPSIPTLPLNGAPAASTATVSVKKLPPAKIPSLGIAEQQPKEYRYNDNQHAEDHEAEDHDHPSTDVMPQYEADAEVAPPVDLQDVLDAISSRQLKIQKDAFREQAKARVEAQAYSRCLTQLEASAAGDDQTRYEQRRDTESWHQKVQDARHKTATEAATLKQALHSQMEANERKAQRARMDQKQSISAFILGETAGMAASPVGSMVAADGTVINSRMRISKDLEEQIRRNAENKRRVERETKVRERDQMERMALETEMQQVIARTEQLEKQRQLLNAWERDGHIRNLQKLQVHGSSTIKEYIDRNLASPPGSAAFNTHQQGAGTVGGMTFGKALTSSIGYDPRVGK